MRDKIFTSAWKLISATAQARVAEYKINAGSKTRPRRRRRPREKSGPWDATRREGNHGFPGVLCSFELRDSRTARSYPTSSTQPVRDHPRAICLVYEWRVAAGARVSEFPSSPREKALRLPLRRLELYYW